LADFPLSQRFDFLGRGQIEAESLICNTQYFI